MFKRVCLCILIVLSLAILICFFMQVESPRIITDMLYIPSLFIFLICSVLLIQDIVQSRSRKKYISASPIFVQPKYRTLSEIEAALQGDRYEKLLVPDHNDIVLYRRCEETTTGLINFNMLCAEYIIFISGIDSTTSLKKTYATIEKSINNALSKDDIHKASHKYTIICMVSEGTSDSIVKGAMAMFSYAVGPVYTTLIWDKSTNKILKSEFPNKTTDALTRLKHMINTYFV